MVLLCAAKSLNGAMCAYFLAVAAFEIDMTQPVCISQLFVFLASI